MINKLNQLIEIDPSIPQLYVLKAWGTYYRFLNLKRPKPDEDISEFWAKEKYPKLEMKDLRM